MRLMSHWLVFLLAVFAVELTQAADNEDFSLRVERLDAWLQAEAQSLHLSGLAVAAFEKDQPLHVRTFGQINPDAALLLGSCTKTYTALATLLALHENDVPLDRELQNVLPNLNLDGAGPVTIRQLLNHRSGIARVDGFQSLPTHSQLESEEFTISAKYAADERFQYSNLNYSILGLVIEEVTGTRFCDYVRERLFLPLGMTHSSCGPTAEILMAPEFQYAFGFPIEVDRTNAATTQIPAGFIRASIRDMGTFMMCMMRNGMHNGSQIFPVELIEEMKRPFGQQEFGYGMGLRRGSWGSDRHVLGHEGATRTSYAIAGFLQEDETGLVLITNINLFDPLTDQGESLFQNSLAILDGHEPTHNRPYVVWFRWAVLALTLSICFRMLAFLWRWKQGRFSIVKPTRLKTWIELAASLLAPIVVWVVVLRFWARTPFCFAFRSQPDIMSAFVLMTGLGISRSVIQTLRKSTPDINQQADVSLPTSE